MSLANEMLTNLLNNEEEPHIVIDPTRKIIVPEQLKRIAVQYDHRIETVTFDCPRYWDGYDMSKMVIYINYVRSDNVHGSYIADNVVVDDENDAIMHFTWTITREATQAAGSISVQICIKYVDDRGYSAIHWNSDISKDMYVSEGLDCSTYNEDVVDDTPDIITLILERVNNANDVIRDIEGSEIDDFNDVRSYGEICFFRQPYNKYAHAPFNSAVVFTKVPTGSDVEYIGGPTIVQTALADDGSIWTRTLTYDMFTDSDVYHAYTVDWVKSSGGTGSVDLSNYVTKEEFGDIDAALDAILAIEEGFAPSAYLPGDEIDPLVE